MCSSLLAQPYIPQCNCKRRCIVYLLIPMATYNTPSLANTLWLDTHSGNIAGGNALQLCGLFKVGRSTLAGIAMDSVDPAVVG